MLKVLVVLFFPLFSIQLYFAFSSLYALMLFSKVSYFSQVCLYCIFQNLTEERYCFITFLNQEKSQAFRIVKTFFDTNRKDFLYWKLSLGLVISVSTQQFPKTNSSQVLVYIPFSSRCQEDISLIARKFLNVMACLRFKVMFKV